MQFLLLIYTKTNVARCIVGNTHHGITHKTVISSTSLSGTYVHGGEYDVSQRTINIKISFELAIDATSDYLPQNSVKGGGLSPLSPQQYTK